MSDVLWFLSGLNLMLLSVDRLNRKKGGLGYDLVRKICPELGAVLFILGGLLKILGL